MDKNFNEYLDKPIERVVTILHSCGHYVQYNVKGYFSETEIDQKMMRAFNDKKCFKCNESNMSVNMVSPTKPYSDFMEDNKSLLEEITIVKKSMENIMNKYPHSLELAREFHEKFEVPILNKPDFPSEDRQILRLKLLKEELLELADAIVDNDIVEVADALCDLQVVLDGTFLEFGLGDTKDHLMMLVHTSNTTKMGEDGKPVRRADGKVIKGPNFEPPRIAEFLAGYSIGDK